MSEKKPYYPKRTSRGHVTVEGVTFISWQIGINQYALKSEDNRLHVSRNYNRSTYSASFDANAASEAKRLWASLGHRFLTERAACAAAVKAMRANDEKARLIAEAKAKAVTRAT